MPLIGRIELAEGLPHPVIDGEWIKTSGARRAGPTSSPTSAKRTIDAMLEYAATARLPRPLPQRPLQDLGALRPPGGPVPERARPDSRRCVEKARAKGLRMGAHTLTNFITTNDPFVTTAANRGADGRRDGRAGRAGVDAAATEIVVDREDYFRQESTLNSVLIGTEIVRYRDVAGEEPVHADGLRPRRLRDRGRAPRQRRGRQEAHGPSLQDALPRLAHAGASSSGTWPASSTRPGPPRWISTATKAPATSAAATTATTTSPRPSSAQVDHLVVNGSSNIGPFLLAREQLHQLGRALVRELPGEPVRAGGSSTSRSWSATTCRTCSAGS
ncbi:MAG: hypothetical protein M0C28_38070 [Candidatus Moduliflexus flocculans]|nr:hypothetical protein [Candidatus Moduliflexus flocculans]